MFMHLYVFLSDGRVIKVIRETDVVVTLQPAGTETWSEYLSIDEMGGRYAVVNYIRNGLWIFTHDGK